MLFDMNTKTIARLFDSVFPYVNKYLPYVVELFFVLVRKARPCKGPLNTHASKVLKSFTNIRHEIVKLYRHPGK